MNQLHKKIICWFVHERTIIIGFVKEILIIFAMHRGQIESKGAKNRFDHLKHVQQK